MNWTLQGSDTVVVHAPAERVWALLKDGPRLPEWMPIVKATNGDVERLGAERTCQVEFGGKRGQVTERCVEHEPMRRIAWRLVDDSLGFGRLFADLGFSFTLEARSDGTTLVRNESYYRPRSPIARALSIVMMRRKFRGIRLVALSNLRALSESALSDSAHAYRPDKVTLVSPS
jgi:uncharacterized protein YndB with AHSA1/START domain